MKKDDWKFLSALLLTALLSGWVVYSSYRKDLAMSAGPTVDLKKIERLQAEGRVTLHPGEYWSAVQEGGP